MLISALEQSLMMVPLVFGIYLTYRILNLTDLTVEGSFVLGAALYARLLHEGAPHSLSIALSLLAGMLAGIVVSWIQKEGQVTGLIASIIMLFMLYSVNFQIMGKPNLNLLEYDLLERWEESFHQPLKIVALGSLSILIFFLLGQFLRSRLGLVLRAYGKNPDLLKSYNKNLFLYRTSGLMVSNGLAALCGILTAQLSGYADIHMGFGVALTGIGAVVIGTQIFYGIKKEIRFNPYFDLLACFVGIYFYFILVHILLALDINSIHLKLFLGLILIFSLRIRGFRKGAQL